MPIRIANSLPARQVLESENIFVMTEDRAAHQDIRPLRIAILNLMPTKIETETQLLRQLSNTPLQVDITLLHTATHRSKNVSAEHLKHFYRSFEEVRQEHFDGLIITGAPVEQMEFEDVDYWDEFGDILAWSRNHAYSTLHICWGAQAGLYYHYGINKEPLPKKLSGVFRHQLLARLHPLMRGFDDTFCMPHSRYTQIVKADLEANDKLHILATSETAGPSIIVTDDGRQIFVTGHIEYDRQTLANEYFRDVEKGIHPDVPQNYFPDDDPQKQPLMPWRSHAYLLFSNWLNYCVYQETPYSWDD